MPLTSLLFSAIGKASSDIEQEAVIKATPKKKKCKKAKWLSEEVLQIAEEKKRSKRQRRKGKIYPFECRVPKNNKER